ncbi:MAG: endo alpha-1,4 polygalactosaminidase [Candidatus Theseobacter exili]|nr:endo alpha-1,4 polygalactosaminidase [Candidatus Theseobacter exili]
MIVKRSGSIPAFFLLYLLFINLIQAFSVAEAQKNNGLQDVSKWFILLSYDPSEQEIDPYIINKYDMAVLDPDYYPSFTMHSKRPLLIAYISVGEAEEYRSYWKSIKDELWIIGENPNWKENHYIDICNDKWQEIILEKVIPMIISKGFNGIMLDTLDTIDVLCDKAPDKCSLYKKAMMDLVKNINEKYPNLLLVSNNGFSILPQIAPFLNGIIVEDINTMPDFKKGGYMKVPSADRKYKIRIIKELIKKFDLPVFNIDYASQDNKRMIRQDIRRSRSLGFKPYVAEKNLDRIYKN